MTTLPILAFVVVLLVVLATQIFKILNEYERGVIFTFGRFTGVKGPGLIILIPLVQRMVKVDLRTVVLDVPTQDVISRDNVSVKVNAVIYFRIVDPAKAIIQVANPFEATSQLAQTTLRSVLGQHELDEMLSQRDKLNVDIQHILDNATDAWGIKVANVEIKHVDLGNDGMGTFSFSDTGDGDILLFRHRKRRMSPFTIRAPGATARRAAWRRRGRACAVPGRTATA